MNPLPLLELDVLRSFLAIVQTGSFSRAAEQVFRSPGALSMQIKRLEEQLGQQLFECSSRKVELTAAGERLQTYARQLLQLNQEALGAMQTAEQEPEIRLGISSCIDSQFLSEILAQCAENHPHIRVRVVVATSARLHQQLAAHELDLALLISGYQGSQALTGPVLFSESLVWVMCRGSRSYQKIPLPLALDERGCLWRDSAIAALDRTELSYRITYSSEQTEGLKAAVMADLAVAPLPKSMLRAPLVEVPASVGLPELTNYQVVLQQSSQSSLEVQSLSHYIRGIFCQMSESHAS